MLELKVCDEDTVTKDDELCTVLFDISKLSVGPTARVTFQMNPEVSNTFREKTETLVWICFLNSFLYFYFVVLSYVLGLPSTEITTFFR